MESVSLFDLRVYGCGVCGRELLAADEPNVRAAGALYGRYGMPETVAGWRSAWWGLRWVPLCAWCLEAGKAVAEPGVAK